jgi:Mrp family chromosome partitioning ATPase/uncharacterized protein involved in exopolysaccharide biosynthesis
MLNLMNHTLSVVRRHWIPLSLLNGLLVATTIYLVKNVGNFSVPTWQATAQLNVPIKGGNLRADLGTLGNLTDGSAALPKEIDPLAVQMTILTSNSVMGRALAADPEKSLYPDLEVYKGLFNIAPQDKTTVLQIEVQGSAPNLAAQRLKTLVDSYQERLDELRIQDAQTREKFAQKELKTAQNNLAQAQGELATFQQRTKLVNPAAQTQELVEAIRELESRQTQLQAEAEARTRENRVASTQIGISPEQAFNALRLAENKEYQSTRDKLSEIEIALSEARGDYTEQMPIVRSLVLQREQLREKLDRQIAKAVPGVSLGTIDPTLGSTGNRLDLIAGMVRTQIAARGLQQQVVQMQNQVDRFNGELAFIANHQTQLLELQRRYDIAEGVYKGIVAQVNQAKINTFESYPNVQLIDGPTLNPEPIQTDPKLIVLGSLLAAVFGSMSLVTFLESRNPLLNTKDLQQVAFPRCFSISHLKSLLLEKGLDRGSEREFQKLAAAISSFELNNHRLMITSARSGEGKTTITLGLAWALVQLGFRVLLVDADLRQAELSQRLGYPQFRRNGQNPNSLLPIHPGFDLMLAPLIREDKIGEFFLQGEFERRLNRAQAFDSYDYILIDSPPIDLVSEAILMSRAIQNVMYVVRPGISDRHSVMDSIELLKQQNVHLQGLIVNGGESTSGNYRYYGNRPERSPEEV